MNSMGNFNVGGPVYQNGALNLPVKFAKIATTADITSTAGSLVTAVTGKKIRVLGYSIQAQVGATTPSFSFWSDTTQLTGLQAAVATAADSAVGNNFAFSPYGLFETAKGEALKLKAGHADNDSLGYLVYVEVPA